MKAIKFVLILVVLTATTGSCEVETTTDQDKQIVVKGNNEFALELYSKLRTNEGNMFFSPYSISTALAMAYAGARGQTEVQMANVLGFPTVPKNTTSDSNKKPTSIENVLSQNRFHSVFGAVIKDLNERGEKGGYELSVANALWGQKGYEFLEEFLELIKINYGGGLYEVDFVKAAESARETINAWVEKQTNEKIKDLIGKGVLNSMTRLVLTNAIYFKGNWASQFEKNRTKDAPFTLINGEKINIPMMNQKEQFGYMERDSFQGLELPYVDNELSMIILLPKRVNGLSSLEEKLTVEKLSQWLTELKKQEVIVSIPKFEITSKFGLSDVLRSMGMTNAFSGDADFTGMTVKRELFISAVIHKAFVEVDEEGTEAAAATGVVVKATAVRPSTVFRADHPFLFLIRDNKSGSILFIGRVMNPKT